MPGMIHEYNRMKDDYAASVVPEECKNIAHKYVYVKKAILLNFSLCVEKNQIWVFFIYCKEF